MTLEEQGAYRNLLDEAHLRGGPIPNDERILAKACGDALAWPRIRKTVLARFTIGDDGLRNETLDEVYARTMELHRERSNAGKLGGIRSGEARRKAKAEASNEANVQANTPSKTPSQTNSPSPSPSPSPDLVSVSGLEEQKKRTAPSAPPLDRKPADNVRIITLVAHEVLKTHNGHPANGADLCDEIKALCAKRHIAYNATVVRKALDSAEVQRRTAS